MSSTASGASELPSFKASAGPRFFLDQFESLAFADPVTFYRERIIAPRQIAGRKAVASVIAVNNVCSRRQTLNC
jgi:hypothetical protein